MTYISVALISSFLLFLLFLSSPPTGAVAASSSDTTYLNLSLSPADGRLLARVCSTDNTTGETVCGPKGTVCDDMYGSFANSLVVDALGAGVCPPGAVKWNHAQYYGLPDVTMPIVADDVSCPFDATTFKDCSFITSHNCLHSEDIVLRCGLRSTNPSPLRWYTPLRWALGAGNMLLFGPEIPTTYHAVCADAFSEDTAYAVCSLLGFNNPTPLWDTVPLNASIASVGMRSLSCSDNSLFCDYVPVNASAHTADQCSEVIALWCTDVDFAGSIDFAGQIKIAPRARDPDDQHRYDQQRLVYDNAVSANYRSVAAALLPLLDYNYGYISVGESSWATSCVYRVQTCNSSDHTCKFINNPSYTTAASISYSNAAFSYSIVPGMMQPVVRSKDRNGNVTGIPFCSYTLYNAPGIQKLWCPTPTTRRFFWVAPELTLLNFNNTSGSSPHDQNARQLLREHYIRNNITPDAVFDNVYDYGPSQPEGWGRSAAYGQQIGWTYSSSRAYMQMYCDKEFAFGTCTGEGLVPMLSPNFYGGYTSLELRDPHHTTSVPFEFLAPNSVANNNTYAALCRMMGYSNATASTINATSVRQVRSYNSMYNLPVMASVKSCPLNATVFSRDCDFTIHHLFERNSLGTFLLARLQCGVPRAPYEFKFIPVNTTGWPPSYSMYGVANTQSISDPNRTHSSGVLLVSLPGDRERSGAVCFYYINTVTVRAICRSMGFSGNNVVYQRVSHDPGILIAGRAICPSGVESGTFSENNCSIDEATKCWTEEALEVDCDAPEVNISFSIDPGTNIVLGRQLGAGSSSNSAELVFSSYNTNREDDFLFAQHICSSIANQSGLADSVVVAESVAWQRGYTEPFTSGNYQIKSLSCHYVGTGTGKNNRTTRCILATPASTSPYYLLAARCRFTTNPQWRSSFPRSVFAPTYPGGSTIRHWIEASVGSTTKAQYHLGPGCGSTCVNMVCRNAGFATNPSLWYGSARTSTSTEYNFYIRDVVCATNANSLDGCNFTVDASLRAPHVNKHTYVWCGGNGERGPWQWRLGGDGFLEAKRPGTAGEWGPVAAAYSWSSNSIGSVFCASTSNGAMELDTFSTQTFNSSFSNVPVPVCRLYCGGAGYSSLEQCSFSEFQCTQYTSPIRIHIQCRPRPSTTTTAITTAPWTTPTYTNAPPTTSGIHYSSTTLPPPLSSTTPGPTGPTGGTAPTTTHPSGTFASSTSLPTTTSTTTTTISTTATTTKHPVFVRPTRGPTTATDPTTTTEANSSDSFSNSGNAANATATAASPLGEAGVPLLAALVALVLILIIVVLVRRRSQKLNEQKEEDDALTMNMINDATAAGTAQMFANQQQPTAAPLQTQPSGIATHAFFALLGGEGGGDGASPEQQQQQQRISGSDLRRAEAASVTSSTMNGLDSEQQIAARALLEAVTGSAPAAGPAAESAAAVGGSGTALAQPAAGSRAADSDVLRAVAKALDKKNGTSAPAPAAAVTAAAVAAPPPPPPAPLPERTERVSMPLSSLGGSASSPPRRGKAAQPVEPVLTLDDL